MDDETVDKIMANVHVAAKDLLKKIDALDPIAKKRWSGVRDVAEKVAHLND